MFETKLLTAEIFTFTLILFAFARIIFANTLFDQIVSILLFVISLGIGILLVRTIRKEYETRERAQALANELATINQELDRMNNQKSEFLSIATHQLRTPLAAINGYTALLLDNSFGAISDTVRQTLQKVLQAEQLMNETIEDFLSVSRIDQGRMVYDMTVFDIRKLVTEVVDELTPATKLKNLTLTSDLGQEALQVNADFGKMKHVIGNLVDNAIKYTPSGFIKITVRKNAQSARVEISDSGVGIPADEIDKLFDKFVRARGASGVNVSGTGLGLYVAKQMVEAHKGRVWAESPGEGKGSTFIAEMPLSSM
jgi:signal transduction histidine kinase